MLRFKGCGLVPFSLVGADVDVAVCRVEDGDCVCFADCHFAFRLDRAILLDDGVGAHRTDDVVACIVIIENVVLGRTQPLGLGKDKAVVFEGVACDVRLVIELTSDVLVDDTELKTAEPCLFLEHRVYLREVRGLRDIEGVGSERGASLDDLVGRGDAVEFVEVDEGELGITSVLLLSLADFHEIADDVCIRFVAPIGQSDHFLLIVDIVVEVEFVGVGC